MKDHLEVPVMPPGEMDALTGFRAFRETRNLALRDQLVCKHLHLVQTVARRFSGLGESLEDLIQEGTIGLIKAVDLFDPERGVKFVTYACHLIASQIQHYLRDRGRLIRQPAWVQELNTKVTRATDQLSQELGRDPQLSEVAMRLQLAESSIAHVLSARELNSITSLSAPSDYTGENDSPFEEKQKPLIDKAAALELPLEDRLLLDEAILSLKPLEQQVIQLYFFEEINQSAIARSMDISVNYASYLLKRAIAKLRTYLENQRREEHTALTASAEASLHTPVACPTIDPLTNLYTEAYLRLRVVEEIARSHRSPTNFAIMFLSLSSKIGGEETRLQCARNIGQTIRRNIRAVDLLTYLGNGRYGMLSPQTGREARILGDRLCKRVAEMPSDGGEADDQPQVLHYGYAVYPMDGTTVEMLMRRADIALAAAQKSHKS